MEEEIILMDTNVLTPGSLMPLLYESRKYSHLPIEPIIETNNSIDCFAGMMYRGDLVIVKGVVDELLDLHKNIIDKVKFLDSKGSGASDEARHNLQLLNSKLNKFIKKARKSQYKPSSKKDYESLVNLVIKLDDRLAIKKRAGYSDNQAVRTTDEKLTASAFYISIFEKKKATVLTNDYDISNLARTVYHLFTNGLDHGYAQSAVEILSENPVQICGYLGEDNITRISFPSDEKPHLFSEGFIKFQKEAKDDIEAIIRLAYGVKL